LENKPADIHLFSPVKGLRVYQTGLSELTAGTIITAGGYDREQGMPQAAGVDLVALAELLIANPDLPERFAVNAELNQWDRSTFYGGDELGYTTRPSNFRLLGNRLAATH